MKKLILVLAVLVMLSQAVRAEDGGGSLSDKSKTGYVLTSIQSQAKFSDGGRSYSAAGALVDVMFHREEPRLIWNDLGLSYSNFGSLASDGSQKFSLNNVQAQGLVAFWGGLYFKGGYGLSFLDSDVQTAPTIGGCWKWGFGWKLHMAKGAYAVIETNRWDGPGPVGFRSHSLGLEYHF